MADSKISALTDGGGLQAGDELAISRSSTSFRATPIGVPVLVYRYTVTGSDKTSIDTGVDTADAGSNDWTNGDLLEVWLYARTDEAVQVSDAFLTFNNDSGASQYVFERLRANGSTSPTSAENLGAANLDLWVPGASYLASTFSAIRMSVPNYRGTVGNKSFEVTNGLATSSSGNGNFLGFAGTYLSTSALSRLALVPPSAKKFKIGTQLLIYKRLSS